MSIIFYTQKEGGNFDSHYSQLNIHCQLFFGFSPSWKDVESCYISIILRVTWFSKLCVTMIILRVTLIILVRNLLIIPCVTIYSIIWLFPTSVCWLIFVNIYLFILSYNILSEPYTWLSCLNIRTVIKSGIVSSRYSWCRFLFFY